MKLSPRDEIIVGVVAIVLLVVILAMVLVRPQINELASMQKTLQDEETAVRSAEADLERLKAAKGEALQVQADLVKVGNQVPDGPQLPSLVVEIQDLANEAGIAFVSIEPKSDSIEIPSSREYTVIPIDLRLRGQFFDVVDFLYRLEHLTREVRVSKLDLAKRRAEGGSETDSASGTLTRPEDELSLEITAKVFVMGVMEGTLPSAPSGGGGGTGSAPEGQ